MDTSVESSLSLGLVFMYSLLGFICLIQILRIVYHRHPLRSFQFWFMFICLAWSVLRIYFFTGSYNLRGRALMTVYWMPVDLQFITFSQQVQFYAFLLYQATWENKRKLFFICYVLINVSVCATTATYIFTGCDSDQCHSGKVNQIHHIYMAIQFSILVLVYGYFAYKMYLRRYANTYTWAATPQSLGLLTGVTWMIFVSRWLYNVQVAVNSKKFAMTLTYGDDGLVNVTVGSFLFQFFWEILPSSFVLLFFKDIPPTQQTVLQRYFPSCFARKGEMSVSDSTGGYASNNMDDLPVYDEYTGCGTILHGCIPSCCLTDHTIIGRFFASLCCFRKRSHSEMLAHQEGNSGYMPPTMDANSYEIMALPFHDNIAINDFGLGRSTSTNAIPNVNFIPIVGSQYGVNMIDDSQIQKQIQAQLEQHARQNSYI